MTETKKTALWRAEMRKHSVLVMPIIGCEWAPAGWPDNYVAHARWRGWLEAKGWDTEVRPEQRSVMRQLRLRAVQVWVLRYPQGASDVWPATLEHPETREVVAECAGVRELIDDLVTLEAMNA